MKKKSEQKAAKAAAARQQQKNQEREKIRQRIRKERLEETEDGEDLSALHLGATSPARVSPRGSSPNNVLHYEKEKEEKKDSTPRPAESDSGDDNSNPSPKKNKGGAPPSPQWGPAPPSPRNMSRRRSSLPLAHKERKDGVKPKEKSRPLSINKPSIRTSGAVARSVTPDRTRPKEKKKGKGKDKRLVVGKDDGKRADSAREMEKKEQRDTDIFLQESLLREGTGKNIDQMAELGWY